MITQTLKKKVKIQQIQNQLLAGHRGRSTGSIGVAPGQAAGWQGWWEQQTELYTLHERCLQGPLPRKGWRSAGTFPPAILPQQEQLGPAASPSPTVFSLAGAASPSCSLGSFSSLLPGQQMLKKCMVGFSPGVWSGRYQGRVIVKEKQQWEENLHSTPWNFLENSLVTLLSIPVDLDSPLILQSSLPSTNHRWPPHLSFNVISLALFSPRCPTSTGTRSTVASGGTNIFI